MWFFDKAISRFLLYIVKNINALKGKYQRSNNKQENFGGVYLALITIVFQRNNMPSNLKQ